MKSVEILFKRKVEENPNLSSFINLGRAIKGEGLNKQTIRKMFAKLVPKVDYEIGDKRILLKHLYSL